MSAVDRQNVIDGFLDVIRISDVSFSQQMDREGNWIEIDDM